MNFRTTLILAVLAAGAAIAVFVLQRQGTPDDSDIVIESQRVFQGAAIEEISRIEFSRRKDDMTIVLERDGADWRLVAPVKGRADWRQVSQLTTMLGNLEYMAQKPLSPKTAIDFGLEPPAATLKFTSGEKTYECAVGHEIRLKESAKSTFVRRSGEAYALLARDALGSLLETDLRQWRDEKLVMWLPGDIARVAIVRGEQTVEARRADGNWMITKPVRVRGNRDAIDGVVRAATGLNAQTFETDSPDELARYGLDKPRLAITLEKKPATPPAADTDAKATGDGVKADDGKAEAEAPESLTIAFGDFTDSSNKAVYAQLSGSSAIVAIVASDVQDLEKDLAALRDSRAFAIDRTGDITFLSVDLAGEAVAVERVAPAKWQITAPQPAPAEAPEVEALLDRLRNVTVTAFDDTAKPTDTRFGFNSPYGTVTFRRSSDTGDTTVLIGRQEPSGDLWVMETGSSSAGRVETDRIDGLKTSWFDLHARSIWKTSAGQTVAGVSWTRGGETVTVARQDDATYKMTSPVEESLDAEKVGKLVAALSTVKAESFLAPAAKAAEYGLDKADMAIEVTLKGQGDPVIHRLQIAEHKGDTVAMLAGGDLVFRLDKSMAGLFDKSMSKDAWGHFDKDRVYRLEVKGPSLDAVFSRSGEDEWSAGDDVAPTDSLRVRWYLGDLSAASASRVVAYAAKDLTAYGLDKPVWRIRVKGLSVDRVFLTSASGPNGGRYASIEGSGRVVVLDSEQISRLTKDKSYFEKKN
jgi:Domain of unknown function (DUF4340)